MENKLKMELDALPTPATSFEELAAIKQKPVNYPRKKKTALLIAAVLAIMLCGAGWAKLQYGMWNIGGSRIWENLQKELEKHDVILPGALDGSPFLSYSKWGHVPRGASHIEALLNPVYRSIDVEYAVETKEIETYPSGEKMSETYTRSEELSLFLGTTTNDLWRYYFQVDENGVWTACDVPDSYETLEYKGLTLQMGDTVRYDSYWERDVYTRWVHWIDIEKQMAFSIAESDYTDPNRVVECAKKIIDLNSKNN